MGFTFNFNKLASSLALSVVVLSAFVVQPAEAAKFNLKKEIEKLCDDYGGIFYDHGDGEYGCWLPEGENVFCTEYTNHCTLILPKGNVAKLDPNKKKKRRFLKSKFKTKRVSTYSAHAGAYPESKAPKSKVFSRRKKRMYKRAYLNFARFQHRPHFGNIMAPNN
jgi:hypothetical protein